MYWSTRLPAFPSGPRFCQRTVPTWDNAPDENSDDNCGPMSIVTQTTYTTGIWIAPDSVKGAIIDPKFPNQPDASLKGIVTSEADLRQFLATNCSIPTTHLDPTTLAGNATGSLLNLLWAKTNSGFSLFELRWWDHPNSGFHHWGICLGLDPTNVFLYDPFVGEILVESYQAHRDMFQGILFSCDRQRDPNLPSA